MISLNDVIQKYSHFSSRYPVKIEEKSSHVKIANDFCSLIQIGLMYENDFSCFLTQNLYDPRLLTLIWNFVHQSRWDQPDVKELVLTRKLDIYQTLTIVSEDPFDMSVILYSDGNEHQTWHLPGKSMECQEFILDINVPNGLAIYVNWSVTFFTFAKIKVYVEGIRFCNAKDLTEIRKNHRINTIIAQRKVIIAHCVIGYPFPENRLSNLESSERSILSFYSLEDTYFEENIPLDFLERGEETEIVLPSEGICRYITLKLRGEQGISLQLWLKNKPYQTWEIPERKHEDNMVNFNLNLPLFIKWKLLLINKDEKGQSSLINAKARMRFYENELDPGKIEGHVITVAQKSLRL